MRILFSIILFTIFSHVAFSQVSLGFRAGYGVHGVNFEPKSLSDDQVAISNPDFGLVFTYVNKGNAGLQAELNYVSKGWREELEEDPSAYFQRNITYLELPILSHFEIGQGRVRPLIIFGPYLGWKLGESVDKNNYDNIIESSAYNHYEQPIRDLNIGIRAALGLRYNITDRIGVYAEFRYDFQILGGRDIFIDRPNDIAASRLTQTNGTFGIIWHLKKQEKNPDFIKYTPKEDLYD